MKNVAPKLKPEEYEKNFAEIHPPLSPNAAIVEANRCLYCYDSPCTRACPTHIDIPGFIKKIATGNLKGSARRILQSNWIALTCAKACPVEELCEGACVYNAREEPPIRIGRLQRHAIDWYFARGMPPLFFLAPANGKSVGVIGGGPSGLSCAAEATLLGYEATVYDANEKPGGLSTWGVAPYKMTQEDALNEARLIQSFGVKIRLGVRVGRDVAIEELERDHDAIFIGAGLGTPSRLNIPGEDLSGVYDALQFIRQVTRRDWPSVDVGRRVAVIGGGNTAIDAVTEARRLGAERVMILYRRGREEMPAYDFEYELAKHDEVEFHFQVAPVRFVGTDHVEAIACIPMRLGAPDEKGRRRPEPADGPEFQIAADMVIKSLGQRLEETFLGNIPNLRIDRDRLCVDPNTLQTSNPKYFAGGDIINGGKEVVNAAADGKRAAHGIDRWLFPEKYRE